MVDGFFAITDDDASLFDGSVDQVKEPGHVAGTQY
jgi:hypothetical protein